MKFCSGDDDPTDVSQPGMLPFLSRRAEIVRLVFQMYRQIGNAVPVPLSEALARELRRTLLRSELDNNTRSSPGSSQRMSE